MDLATKVDSTNKCASLHGCKWNDNGALADNKRCQTDCAQHNVPFYGSGLVAQSACIAGGPETGRVVWCWHIK